jgi:putative ABC transport system permease protein
MDLKIALRSLLRRPGFAGVAVATLALGIGASTLLFSVVNGVLLVPLPYHEPEELVTVFYQTSDEWRTSANDALRRWWDVQTTTLMRVEAWRTTAGPITGVTGYTYCTLPLRVGQGADEPVEAILVDRETFAVLGVAPAFGRLPSADEVRSGAPVAVLRHKTWISRFGGDAHVVGRTFDLGDVTYTVIGVMPPGFFFPTEQGGDLWVPVTSEARSWPSFYALARLAPGASVEEASDFLERVARRLGEEEPPEAALGARAVLHLDNVVSNVKGGIELLFGTALLVVLVACVNLGNLFLGRAAGRREELLSTASSPDATTGRLTFTTPASSSPSTGSGSRTSFSVACSGTSAHTGCSTSSTPSTCSPGRDPVGSASTLPSASSVTTVPASSASTPSPALPPWPLPTRGRRSMAIPQAW